VRPRLNRGRSCRFCIVGLCVRKSGHAELGRGNSHGRSTTKAAAIMVDFFGHSDRTHSCISLVRGLPAKLSVARGRFVFMNPCWIEFLFKAVTFLPPKKFWRFWNASGANRFSDHRAFLKAPKPAPSDANRSGARPAYAWQP